jgi:4-diphosphocytidyl-2-C-methyl-D-erythritol kinase
MDFWGTEPLYLRNQATVRAYAKINLCLNVIQKRGDGYHEIESVMQSVSLYDRIYMKRVEKENYLKIISDSRCVPTDERNIVFRAVKTMSERYGLSGGIFCSIGKTIPVSAGLGGGSSDGAAALSAVNRLFGLGLGLGELMETARGLGADAPFFFIGGTALAKGAGEILSPLPPLPPCFIVLAKPPVFVSTAEIFKGFDESGLPGVRADVERMIYFLEKSDIKGVCSCFGNALESVTTAIHPIIGELKSQMLRNGALGAAMSGSGGTVFGCFHEKQAALAAVEAISVSHPEVREVFVVKNSRR